jgi:hypothetical protein
MDGPMSRPLAAIVLAAGLLLTAGCSEDNTSGDTNTDNQVEQVPSQSPS